jgi:hypothetical protein
MTRRRKLTLATSALLIALLAAHGALAALGATITPTKSTIWNANQVVPFKWRDGSVPPSWLRPAIESGVADSAASRQSKAALFERRDSATSWIGYMQDVCTETAIACAWRNPPDSFTVRFRPHGHVFDWGTLRWCQFYDSPPDGCIDAEMVTLHELGHVQGLNHVDLADLDHYLDSIMHPVSRSKPKTGWNAHAFGRCDWGALQTLYRPLDATTKISTCLSLATTTTLSASHTTVAYKAGVTFTAGLSIAADVAYKRLRSWPLSDRTIELQRRAPGTTSWTTVATMPAGTSDGTYSLVVYPTATYDWRARFATPAGEGVHGSSSSAVRVTVGSCTSGCPQGVPDPATSSSDEGGGL